MRVRALLVQILARMGDMEGAEHVLADQDREAGETRDPAAAGRELSTPSTWPSPTAY
jgi:hypothetical protein